MAEPASRTPPALALRGLAKSFGTGLGRRRVSVLEGIDLELEPGASLGLVGPNGSGKSTLLRIAAAVEPPSAGSVRIFGLPPADPAARRRLGFLPERSPFPPELGARETLELLGALQGMPRRERRRRGAELLARVGLEAAARKPLGRFSRGMLRRFGLAQAFLHRPDLILLDEPTAGLDAAGFLVLAELLEEARERAASVVIASHLLSDVLAHGDRIAVLLAGRVAALGAPLELVGERGRVRLELRGAGEATLDAIGELVAREGGEVLARGPGTGTLLELYRRLSGPAAENGREADD